MIRAPHLTSESIALANLDAEIGRLSGRVRENLRPEDSAELVDNLLVRASVTGDASDAAESDTWSALTVHAVPGSAAARLSRARCLAYLHRFPEADSELEQAERHGATETDLVPERISLWQACGHLDDALELAQQTAQRRGDSPSLGQLACLYAAAGRREEAEKTFDGAVGAFRSVSPIAFAALCCDWAHTMEHSDDLDEAIAGYRAALDGMPTHARARRALDRVIAEASPDSYQ